MISFKHYTLINLKNKINNLKLKFNETLIKL
ncbi:hypothetical protein BHY_1348 (plasmid) [Borrelia nietonii YOR]|uniref:Uncharacterized protein n=1 Tax=Borrelia nietonii YOR TaxID=1293576 RepID=W5SB28_9SPIR|nr:hypothetical protein BHY_1348 [Borrelia nietonii YOR]